MILRRESHVVLWAGALLAIALALNHTYSAGEGGGVDPAPSRSFTDVGYPKGTVVESTAPRRLLVSVPADTRTLFPLPLDFPRADGSASVSAEPVLKAILTRDASPMAVFLDPSTGAHHVAREGDVIPGALELQHIGTDRVVLRSGDSSRVLHLRGEGEQP